ncbi:MAG: LysE family translocator [Sulfitobacter sp.]
MTVQAWWAFTLASSFAILCPGPAITLTISNALQFRFFTVVSQTFGNLLGLAIVSSLVIFGIDQLSALSPDAIIALRLAGAVYILIIGVRYILVQSASPDKRRGMLPCGYKCPKIACLEGFLVAVTNPQTFLFFLSLFPNFINVDASLGPQFLLLVPSVLAISFFSMMSYGLAARFGKRRFLAVLNPDVISNFMGYCLILFSIVLIMMHGRA